MRRLSAFPRRRYYGSVPESAPVPNHGHVNARPDGRKIDCGGPEVCFACAADNLDQLDEIRRLGT